MAIGASFGILKIIHWHQGEINASPKYLRQYKRRISCLFQTFRQRANDDDLPIFLGTLGRFSKQPKNCTQLNGNIRNFVPKYTNAVLIEFQIWKIKVINYILTQYQKGCCANDLCLPMFKTDF